MEDIIIQGIEIPYVANTVSRTAMIQHSLTLTLSLMMVGSVSGTDAVTASNFNKTWADAMTHQSCEMVNVSGLSPSQYADIDNGTFWIPSDGVVTEWIHMSGCFDSEINNWTASMRFTTIQNCILFCKEGRFGIVRDMCICNSSYRTSSHRCFARTCSEDDVFCGIMNLHADYWFCLCEYVMQSTEVESTATIEDTCVSHRQHNSRLGTYRATKCSMPLKALCIDHDTNKLDITAQFLNWSSSGYQCYKDNKHFVHQTSLSNGNHKLWVAIFRRKLNVLSLQNFTVHELHRNLYCSAIMVEAGRSDIVLRNCADTPPVLCTGSTPSTSTLGGYILIGLIIGGLVLLIAIITAIVLCRKLTGRRRAVRGQRDNDNRGSPQSEENRHSRETGGANTNYDIYDELHKRRRHSGEAEDIYNHTSSDNAYGQIQRGRVSHTDPADTTYDSMAGIRASEGAYAMTINIRSEVDGEYGHLQGLHVTHKIDTVDEDYDQLTMP